ncbi:DEAD/DEAH box helicase [Salisediminibacterium halotolerans]|uniref:DEAD/DEAH box helicase n=2 Tax=Salisediminibacterium halotolerans TaxID=517425 RepID=UPI000F1726A9|nr:DEAD/DEAH box helicase [Salisediminibacterium halotolerans]RLJ74466.1 SNF2 family DNA or RNA helicase [Actinophytocola xinjiangensis]RPE87441.1 SNF2 family DNA or RNA helicase [Salisediminibacterium halotolerans]TWG35302.1 SNF2 family DNA or RNA helicase [Salisediminibacterium halotolerans]
MTSLPSIIMTTQNNSALIGLKPKDPSAYRRKEVLRWKQELFRADKDSFYGIRYDISSDAKGSYYVEIPFADTFRVAAMLAEKFPLLQADNLLQLRYKIAQFAIEPSANGCWQFHDLCPLFSAELADRLIRSELETSEAFKQKLSRFYRQVQDLNISAYTENWLHTLAHGGRHDSVSFEALNVAQKLWRNPNSHVFQFLYVLSPPAHGDNIWSVKPFIKDLISRQIVSIDDILKGLHPFHENPLPYIRSLHKLLTKLQPITVNIDSARANLTLQKSDVVSFLEKDVTLFENNGIELYIPDFLKKQIQPEATGSFHPQIEDKTSAAQRPPVNGKLAWQITLDQSAVDIETLRSLVEQQIELIQIQTSWVRFDLDAAARLVENIDRLSHDLPEEVIYQSVRESLTGTNEKHKRFHPGMQINIPEINEWLTPQADRSAPSIPGEWEEKMFPHQKEGVSWLLHMNKIGFGACLADDMGLGKTLQATVFLSLVQSSEEPSLILVPSSLLHHWKQELNSFSPDLPVRLYTGSPADRKTRFNNGPGGTVWVCSYTTALNDIGVLKQTGWQNIIFDEAQTLKNHRSKLHRAVKTLACKQRIALTGTPVENYPEDIWSLMDVLNPGYLHDKSWFYDQYVKHASKDEQKENFQQLRQIIQPFIFRRTKTDLKDQFQLTDKSIVHHCVSLSTEQMTMYKAVADQFIQEMNDVSAEARPRCIFKAMTQLKQICNHPGQLCKERGAGRFRSNRSPKWDQAVELIEYWKRKGKKGLVFTQYRYSGELFRDYARENWRIDIPFYHGGLSERGRQKILDLFKHAKDLPFMVISLRAGGVGLNLTEASEVLHFDRWWNPAVENQATDRIHRFGQTEHVRIHTITATGTIEERITEIIDQKEEMQDSIIDGEAAPLWTLADEELIRLFQYQ